MKQKTKGESKNFPDSIVNLVFKSFHGICLTLTCYGVTEMLLSTLLRVKIRGDWVPFPTLQFSEFIKVEKRKYCNDHDCIGYIKNRGDGPQTSMIVHPSRELT